jgi:hypothetical protein
MNDTLNQMNVGQQARAAALQQAAPLAMMFAQMAGKPMDIDAVLDTANKLASYIQSGIRYLP